MKILKWLKRIGLGFLSLLVLLLLGGITYEQVSRNKMEKSFSELEGKFVDVGGHKLYYEILGSGSPTVIFESGMPGDHRGWKENMEVLSEFGTAISYDRAGMLFSERGNNEKNAENISDELYTLLKTEKLEPPYILVGHSAGGIFIRPFVEKHKSEVSGVVLLDSSHPERDRRAPDELKALMTPPAFINKTVLSFANRIGLLRIATRDPYLYLCIKKNGAIDEMNYIMQEELRLNDDAPFGDIPLTVITADSKDKNNGYIQDPVKRDLMRDYWISLQKELATLSSNSNHIISEEHDHSFQGNQDLVNHEIIQMMIPADSLIAIK